MIEVGERTDIMPLVWDEDIARCLATLMHTGQTDKAGQTYINHPSRVVDHLKAHPRFAQLGSSQDRDYAVMAAWLHDVIEDTDITASIMAELGAPAEVVDTVTLLTRQPDIPDETYYERIRWNPLALLVKECDILDNTDPKRLAVLDEKTQHRLRSRYGKAKRALGILSKG